MTPGEGVFLMAVLIAAGFALQRIWKYAIDPRCPVCCSGKILVRHIHTNLGDVEFYLCESCPHTWTSK
jgi:DNA-directed RNA polymerase subunit M/transcription elongation factor TFIIS